MTIIHSPCRDVSIPGVDIPTLLFDRRSSVFPQAHPIFIDAKSNDLVTYEQIKDTSKRFGAALQDKWKWKKGDVMCVITANNIDFGCIIWGVHCALGIVTPANPLYTAQEIAHQLKHSRAKGIVTDTGSLERVQQAARIVGLSPERILVHDLKTGGDQRSWKGFLGERHAAPTSGRINPIEDLAFICYSSGTTGLPKGVKITHKNIVSNIHQAQPLDFSELDWRKDKLVGLLPFYHIYGLMTNIHLPIYNGIPVVVHKNFDIRTFLKSIQDYRITMIHVVPPIILSLANHPLVDKFDISCLRMIVCGAAPLTHELQTAMHQRLKVRVKQAYGLTETSPLVLSSPWNMWNVFGSSGWLMPNMRMKFVDEGQEVQRGKVGELWLKGPNVMQGYLDDMEATRNAFSDDGWFKTGDVGYIDEHNNVYITDRAKELIKYKGYQVAPAELEGVILAKPEVADVCVVGVYSPEHATEMPRALCVLKEGIAPSEDLKKNIIAFVARKVVHYKQLRGGVSFISDIPKSPSGKILRRVLRAQESKKVSSASKL